MLADLGELLAAILAGGRPRRLRGSDHRRQRRSERQPSRPAAGQAQRLGELYALDPRGCQIFRVLRRLWLVDVPGRPLLAMLCALARDPLLRSTAPAVLALPVGTELVRSTFLDEIREVVGGRLNESVLDKVARNAASSWAQSGTPETAACERYGPAWRRRPAPWRWLSGSVPSKGSVVRRCSTAAGHGCSTVLGRISCRWRSRRSGSV